MVIVHGAYRPKLWVDAWHYTEHGIQDALRPGYNPRKRLMSCFVISFVVIGAMLAA